MTILPDPSILVIDDEEANVALLGAILQRAGYRRVQTSTDPIHGVQLAEAATPDLILLDLSMPILDGYGVMERLRAAQTPASFLPILILTADVNPKTRRRALAGGATDFVTKPFDNDEVVLRCKNLLATRGLHLALQGQNARLEETVQQRTNELERTLVELKAAQQQQVQQERLRALGEMSNGVANDFNNQLTVLVGYSDLLLLNDAQILNNKPMALRYLQTIHTAAHDSVRVVARLRDFYRPREADDVFLPIDLPKLVQETAMLTQPKWRSQARAAGRSVTVKLELTAVPDVAGNAAELREVVTNLIFNAVDAMAVDGTIILRTRPTDDGMALLEVADTGIGMTEEVRAPLPGAVLHHEGRDRARVWGSRWCTASSSGTTVRAGHPHASPAAARRSCMRLPIFRGQRRRWGQAWPTGAPEHPPGAPAARSCWSSRTTRRCGRWSASSCGAIDHAVSTAVSGREGLDEIRGRGRVRPGGDGPGLGGD